MSTPCIHCLCPTQCQHCSCAACAVQQSVAPPYVAHQLRPMLPAHYQRATAAPSTAAAAVLQLRVCANPTCAREGVIMSRTAHDGQAVRYSMRTGRWLSWLALLLAGCCLQRRRQLGGWGRPHPGPHPPHVLRSSLGTTHTLLLRRNGSGGRAQRRM